MCGICGFIQYDDRYPEEERRDILTRMNRAMTHRGPDDEGYYLKNPAYLAMRRLSIIDRKAGHQPISNRDETLWIIFNGEIYNYRELRQGLEADGYFFKTHSDTEVILHLYEKKGEAFVHDLNGMFAIAIWDTRTQMLVLGRDRFGKKPLYYAEGPQGFYFASELKSLLHHPAIPKKLDPNGLFHFLSYDYVPYPYSILKGIQKLPPGHLLCLKNRTVEKKPYWDLDLVTNRASDLPVEEDRLAVMLRNRLRRAVEYRLESEVPLGVFLSGGIDSSLITALMCELRPAKEVNTFSIHFNEKSFDESDYSTLVASRLGTHHHSRLFQGRDLLDLLPTLLEGLDEPFADASVFPTYLLSKFTREHVTVALSGDGADELFAGYPTFQAERLLPCYRKIPSLLRRAIERIIWALPSRSNNMSLDFKLKQFISGLQYHGIRRSQAWLSGFMPHELDSLLTDSFRMSLDERDPYSLLDQSMAACTSSDSIQRLSYFYCKFYLAEDILTKTDRASMANSLEVRAPFLDKDLVDFTRQIEGSLKLRHLTSKYLLKKAARGLIPDRIIDRPKKGFGIPIAHWLRHELKDLVASEFKSQWMRESGIFNPPEIDRLLSEHWAGTHDHRKKLFPLFMFALWKKHVECSL